MRRQVLCIALVLGGCASLSGPERVWWKPGVTREGMLSDLREARDAAEATGRTDLDTPQSLGGTTPRRKMVEREMRARGYAEQPVHQAPIVGE